MGAATPCALPARGWTRRRSTSRCARPVSFTASSCCTSVGLRCRCTSARWDGRRAAAVDAPDRRYAPRADELRTMGFAAIGLPVGEWIVEQRWWAGRRHQMMTAVQRWAAEHAIAAGMPLETLRQQVGLPASELVPRLLDDTGLHVADGVVRPPGARLPPRVDKPVRTVGEWLAADRSGRRRPTSWPSSSSAPASLPLRYGPATDPGRVARTRRPPRRGVAFGPTLATADCGHGVDMRRATVPYRSKRS